MENPKSQVVDSLQKANNVLVTVSNNPSVDQLAACIGLTLLLNKMGKHATAVFSGKVPETMEFLQPEETIEKNTDSLRDFIISLDKAKADKLRYKVEDTMVKIFITPYKTSIDESDLEYSQGDFNVDAVVALGVHEKEELDQAITSHGRILHDATVISINVQSAGNLGTINWVEPAASSLSEMLTDVGTQLKADALDGQMATAFLTGIVAETARFSNEKTSSNTMNISAQLMAAGANQQLVANKLQESVNPDQAEGEASPVRDTLVVDHPDDTTDNPEDNLSLPPLEDMPTYEPQPQEDAVPQVELPAAELIDPVPQVELPQQLPPEQPAVQENTSAIQGGGSEFVEEPPEHGGTLTANTQPEGLDPAVDPFSATGPATPLLNRDQPLSNTDINTPPPAPVSNEDLRAILDTPVPDNRTIVNLEEAVNSPHVTANTPADPLADPTLEARNAVDQALQAAGNQPALEPITALNAQPIDLNLGHNDQPTDQPPPGPGPLDPGTGLPANLVPPMTGLPSDNTATGVTNPLAPPPVPPPMTAPEDAQEQPLPPPPTY